MNAIILAAGLGTRMRPLTDNRPKCMVPVMGEPIVERQIKLLRERNINDIVLVSGYMAHSLDYLKDKYGVNIVFNPKYDTVNNIYSLYVAQNYFGDSYIIEGDVYIDENCLREHIDRSTYFSVSKPYSDEWGLVCDNGVLRHVNIGAGDGPIMSGISYWSREDAEIIKRRMNDLISTDVYANLFWDNVVLDVLDTLSPVSVEVVKGIYEVDTVAELKDLELLISSKLTH